MKSSIKNRLLKNFLLIIVITVLILEISLINGIRHYYYKNIEDLLTNQLDFSINYLSRYLEINSLEDIIMDDIDLFWNQTTAQIQVFNKEGSLLLDSLGQINQETFGDVAKALTGSKAVGVGENDNYASEVMSVSKPIYKQEEIVGVLRFTSSLEETKEIVFNISSLLIFMGLIVVIISGIVGVFLANSIVRPLEEVTRTAEKMADGQLEVRSRIKYDDEIGKLSDTLNYMAEEIIKKEEIKNDFISSISHELKTPLTSIKGWAITLQEEVEENEILEEGLDIIEKESDRLSNLLEELLDFSRFVSGDISLRKTEISISNLIKSIYKQVSPRARLKDIKLGLSMEEDVDRIIGDEDRIKQVMINILDNALKFSQPFTEISIRLLRKDDFVVVEVIDQGIGISPEDLPNVKEKFYKGKTSNSHTGIGLSICDEIVRLHGGELLIESEEGLGTQVSFSLPIGDLAYE